MSTIIPTKEEHDVGKLKTEQAEALEKETELENEVNFFVAQLCAAIRLGKDRVDVVTGKGLSFPARDRVVAFFAAGGWELKIHYDVPLHCEWRWTR
jgi:hypothetical protein